jgi:transposase-like protein
MQRKQYSTEFKTKAALEAIKGLKTVNEIASELGVHPSQIALWKKQALDALYQRHFRVIEDTNRQPRRI